MKKLGRLWPLLIIFAVALAVFVFCIHSIISSSEKADSDVSSQTAQAFDSAVNTTPPSVSASPTQSTDNAALASESVSATATTDEGSTPTPSAEPVSTATPSPTPVATPSPTLEIVTVIDNNVYEYTDNSYEHVDASSADTADAATQIIRLINQTRNEYGLSGLYYDGTLAGVASVRVNEITSNFSHIRPNGSDCFSAFPSGYNFMGENLAEADGIISASDFAQGCVKYWMESPSHRENILNASYTNTAVAVVVSGGCMYAVQTFGTPS